MKEFPKVLEKSSVICPNCGEYYFTNGTYLVCSNGNCGAWAKKIPINKKEEKDYGKRI
jgi:hypothetical protein